MLLDHDPNRDAPDVRVYEYKNTEVHVQRKDPYGFWHAKLANGPNPAELQGTFTTIEQAELAIAQLKSRKEK